MFHISHSNSRILKTRLITVSFLWIETKCIPYDFKCSLAQVHWNTRDRVKWSIPWKLHELKQLSSKSQLYPDVLPFACEVYNYFKSLKGGVVLYAWSAQSIGAFIENPTWKTRPVIWINSNEIQTNIHSTVNYMSLCWRFNLQTQQNMRVTKLLSYCGFVLVQNRDPFPNVRS